MLSGHLTCNAKALDSNTNIVQSPAASDKIDESVLSDEKTVQSKINRSTKEVNNVLKQIKLDASFSDVKYNKKDKNKIFLSDIIILFLSLYYLIHKYYQM